MSLALVDAVPKTTATGEDLIAVPTKRLQYSATLLLAAVR
jgi:hypothetical protein